MRKIYMSFFHRYGWYLQFLEDDLKTSLRRTLTFQHPQKIRDFIDRTPTKQDLAFKQAIDEAIAMGRGGTYLMVTDDQYRKLK